MSIFLNVRGEDKLYKKIQFRLELDVSQNRFIFPRDPNNEYIVDDVSNQVSAYGNTFNFYSKGTDGSSFAGLYMKEVSTSKKCPVTTFCLDTQGSKYVWYAELGDSEKCDEKYDSRVSQTIDEFGANSGLVLKTEETDYGSKLIDRNNMLSILSCEELLGGDSEDDEIIGMLKALVLMLRIAVPILMIVLGALDFVKAIFADDESQMKKAQGKFVKRLILGVCIFLIPSFLKLLLTIANGIWGNIDTDFCGIL